MGFFDAANVLSLSRIGLAVVVWLRPQDPLFLLVVVAVAAATDGLDGWVGRRTHVGREGTANVGAWLDPLCDKIFVASTAAAVVFAWYVPLHILALVLVRDLGILVLVIVFRVVGGREQFHAHDFRARWFGKATMVAQLATLASVVVLPRFVFGLALTSAILGVAAVIERIALVVRDVRAPRLAT